MKPIKKPKQWAGLGDAVEAVAQVTGIAKVTETITKVTGKDCGCAGRKAKLNQQFPLRPAQTDEASPEDLPEAG